MELDKRLQSVLVCRGCAAQPDYSNMPLSLSAVWAVEHEDDVTGTDHLFFVCALCAKFYQHSVECRVQRLATYRHADWSRLRDLNLHGNVWLDRSENARIVIGIYLNATQGSHREWQQSERSATAPTISYRTSSRRPIPAGLRYQILQRDGFRCCTCGRSPVQHGVVLHVDHIVAVAKGGTNEPSNLRALCAECNLGKGDR